MSEPSSPDALDPAVSVQDAFDQAVRDAQALPRSPDNQTLLALYALYKQATVGDVVGERPGGFDFRGAAKYDAWAARRGLDPAAARREYAALVERLKRA